MHKTVIAAAAAALVFVPVTANAAGTHHQLAAKKTPKPPVAGKWKVVNDANGPEVTGGSMTVTKGHKDIKDLVVVLGSDAETACGGGTFRIPVKQKIIDAKGEIDEGTITKYNEWAVGKNNENADPVIEGRTVKLHTNGKVRKATFWMVFQHGDKGNGEINFGGVCQLDFGLKH